MTDEKKPNFPYVVAPVKLLELLKKIPDIGVPPHFQLKTLKGLGFTSSNDERFLPVMKFIGLINGAGVPTELWTEARGDLGVALAKGLRAGYGGLFQQYPNAHQKDDEALRTFFSVHSGSGKDAVTRMVSTFKALCSVAVFQPGDIKEKKHSEQDDKAKPNKPEVHDPVRKSPASVSINIQLQVPADPTGEIYDKFFAAMAKHLPVSV